MIKREALYADIKSTFGIHPIKGDIILSEDEVAVKNSIKNLIFTSPYERYRKPKLGAGIPADLFNNISPETEYEVKSRIEHAIENYEPRARLVRVTCVASPDLNGYEVSIYFEVENSTEPVILNQILRRVR